MVEVIGIALTEVPERTDVERLRDVSSIFTSVCTVEDCSFVLSKTLLTSDGEEIGTVQELLECNEEG